MERPHVVLAQPSFWVSTAHTPNTWVKKPLALWVNLSSESQGGPTPLHPIPISEHRFCEHNKSGCFIPLRFEMVCKDHSSGFLPISVFSIYWFLPVSLNVGLPLSVLTPLAISFRLMALNTTMTTPKCITSARPLPWTSDYYIHLFVWHSCLYFWKVTTNRYKPTILSNNTFKCNVFVDILAQSHYSLLLENSGISL